VDDERRADVAVVDIPEEGPFDGCNLSVKCGLDGSERFAVGGQGFTLPFRVLGDHPSHVTGPDTQGPRTTDSSLITKSNFRSELRSQSRIQ
jgi:hypothetical protein